MKYSLLLLFLIPFLQGCPYESDIPLEDKETAGLHPLLEGTWESNEARKPSQTIISPRNESEYTIKHYRQVSNRISILTFHGFLTQIDDVYFANIYEPEINYTKGGYFIFRLQFMNDNKLKIWELNRYAVETTFKSSSELQEFLRKRKDDPTLFNSSEIWVRK